jgi:two-component system, sensor histidine kinase PdtaS
MLLKVAAIHRWPLWIRITVTGSAVAAAYLLQIPLEREVPGEPFLLFLLVVIGATFAFGATTGLVGVAMTTALSILFFEPSASFPLHHAVDLVKIEVFAILATACVFALAHYCDVLNSSLKQAEEKKSLFFFELAHGVANNFAAIAALISLKSLSVKDSDARAVLDEAIEQVKVMGRVHGRLRAGEHEALVDSEGFFGELCNDLKVSVARGHPVSVECKADSILMCMDQAMSLGLIVNELVTNAIKHAFPHGRSGRIRVAFEVLKDELRLCVEDDGVGFRTPVRKGTGMGQNLVSGLTGQLAGHLQVVSTSSGSSFRLSIPFASPVSSIQSKEPSAASIH